MIRLIALHTLNFDGRLANDDRGFAQVVILAGEPDASTGPCELTFNALQLRYPQNQIRASVGLGALY